MKKKTCIIFLCLLSFFVNATIAQESVTDDFDDFDSLFDNVADVTVEEQNAIVITQTPIAPASESQNGIKFFDALSSEAGVGAIIKSQSLDPAFFAQFANTFGFHINTDSMFSVHGSLHTSFPDFKLSIPMLYFDMLVLTRLYVTIGIKTNTWGYTRLFSSDAVKNKILDKEDKKENDEYGNPISEKEADVTLMPNVLYDSGKYFSLFFHLPFNLVDFSATVMYPFINESSRDFSTIKPKNLAYAGSVETTILKTSINLFFRTYSSEAENSQIPHALGIEAKSTVLDTDVYGQFISRMGEISLAEKPHYDMFTGILGVYKYWESKTDRLYGANIEYQYAYLPLDPNHHRNRLRAYIGATRIGSKRNLRPGIEIYHDFTGTEGYIKLGLIVLNVMPSTQWKNGIQIDYGGINNSPKVTIASSLAINFDF